MKIKVWRNPYDTGVNLTTPKEIEFNPGLTVIAGCNGSGKTTLILNIEEELKNASVPFCIFNNLKDGGANAISGAFSGISGFESDTISLGVSLWTASEGEAIKINLGRNSTLYKEFLKTGYFKDGSYRFRQAFNDDKSEPECESNVRVFLYDATDSGLSIDSIIEIKLMFSKILEDSKALNLETYIIITANEYELCRNENCFDVNKGKYITFADYEDYREFILKSRALKEKRLDKEDAYHKKQLEKAKNKLKKLEEDTSNKIAKIREKAKSENRDLTFSEKYNIESYQKEVKRFKERNGL